MKDLIILHSLGVSTNFQIPLFLPKFCLSQLMSSSDIYLLHTTTIAGFLISQIISHSHHPSKILGKTASNLDMNSRVNWFFYIFFFFLSTVLLLGLVTCSNLRIQVWWYEISRILVRSAAQYSQVIQIFSTFKTWSKTSFDHLIT